MKSRTKPNICGTRVISQMTRIVSEEGHMRGFKSAFLVESKYLFLPKRPHPFILFKKNLQSNCCLAQVESIKLPTGATEFNDLGF